MYDTIINPITNRKVNVHSRLGQKILREYEKELYKNTYKSKIYRGGGLPARCTNSTLMRTRYGVGKPPKNAHYTGHNQHDKSTAP